MKQKTILFVCKANVGRSQMAEGFYNHLFKSKIARSAGVEDVVIKYNGRPTQKIINVMLEEGIDISNQEIKKVTPSMISSSSKVVVLCEKHVCPPFIIENKNTIFLPVEDPDQMEDNQLRNVRNTIKKIVLSLGLSGST